MCSPTCRTIVEGQERQYNTNIVRDNWDFYHVNWQLKVMKIRQDSCIRGYHVYNEIWTAVLGEVLLTQRELHNVTNCYAVAVKKYSGETVGHLPRKISRLCSMFIGQGGNITCVVTGDRRYSSDLVQGGLEIPCSIIFHGKEKLISKIKKLQDLKKKLSAKLKETTN